QGIRLATVNRVEALIGGNTRADAEALAPVSREYGLILINSAGQIGSSSNITAFALGLSADERARVLDRFLVDTLKVESLALVIDGRETASNAFADALTRMV